MEFHQFVACDGEGVGRMDFRLSPVVPASFPRGLFSRDHIAIVDATIQTAAAQDFDLGLRPAFFG